MATIFNQSSQLNLRKQLRNNLTKSETVLWKHLRGSQIGFKFRRQCGIGPYIVDFYCPRLKLVIEIDGLSHYDEKVFDNDLVRQNYLERLGLTVQRLNSQDIFYKLEDVKTAIYQTCIMLSETTPRPSFVRRGQTGDSLL